MTKIEEIEQQLNKLQNMVELALNVDIVACKQALAELKEGKKEGKWKPKDGEKFWYRNLKGESESYTHEDSFNIDEWAINNLPIFKTEEECEKYWHFMDTVKEKSYEFSKEDFRDDGIGKYYIYYDFEDDEIHVSSFCTTKCLGEPYFKTRDDAQYIIDNFKEELLKYWL